jgi:hypothetical protein
VAYATEVEKLDNPPLLDDFADMRMRSEDILRDFLEDSRIRGRMEHLVAMNSSPASVAMLLIQAGASAVLLIADSQWEAARSVFARTWSDIQHRA